MSAFQVMMLIGVGVTIALLGGILGTLLASSPGTARGSVGHLRRARSWLGGRLTAKEKKAVFATATIAIFLLVIIALFFQTSIHQGWFILLILVTLGGMAFASASWGRFAIWTFLLVSIVCILTLIFFPTENAVAQPVAAIPAAAVSAPAAPCPDKVLVIDDGNGQTRIHW